MEGTLVYINVEGSNKQEVVQLVRLQDFNDKLEWTGDWSSKSDRWTEELKTHLNYDQVYASSQFYMTLEDYISYFNSTSIAQAHLNKNYPFYRSSVKVSHGINSYSLVQFSTLQKCSKVYISLHQMSKLGGSGPYSQIRVIIGRQDKNRTIVEYLKGI